MRTPAVPAGRAAADRHGTHHLRAGSRRRPAPWSRAPHGESPELLADIVACRSTTPARLQKHLRGDLDNIIVMAMRKDAEPSLQLGRTAGRRPGASSQRPAGARDERHLAVSHAQVRRPPRARGRRVGCWRSSRSTAFASITFVQAQRIAHERDIATAERTRAEQVSSFLVELFELSDPSRSRGNQVTARELLDIGARRVSLGLADQPETRATLLGTIGSRLRQPRLVRRCGLPAARKR